MQEEPVYSHFLGNVSKQHLYDASCQNMDKVVKTTFDHVESTPILLVSRNMPTCGGGRSWVLRKGGGDKLLATSGHAGKDEIHIK